jgi:CRISPR/Cas system-associated exonuclease Cas4 (RecB family)
MPDTSKKLDFHKLFEDFNTANQKVWEHDRSTTVGASEVFTCLRKAWFEKRAKEFGIEPDSEYKDSWGATRRGDLMENYHVVPAVSNHLPDGAVLLMAGDTQETLVYGHASATPDGLIVGLENDALADHGIPDLETGEVMFEIKSIDPRANLEEEKGNHHGQTQMQMGLIHKLTNHRPKWAVILYVNASFYDDIKVFAVPFDENVFNNGLKRAATVFEVDDAKEIRPEGKFSGDCEYCRWRGACGTAVKESIPEQMKKAAEDPESVEALLDPITEYFTAKVEYDAANARFEEAKQGIKDTIMEIGKRKVKGDGWQVSWTFVEGRESFDIAAMKEDGIDVDAYKKQGNGYDKLTVTAQTTKE